MTNQQIKTFCLQACRQFIESRIQAARKAMNEAQEAANEETKGSVGDKHETGRAMMQLERDKHARTLADALEQKKILDQIPVDFSDAKIRTGSLVFTTTGTFFISIGAGKIKTETGEIFAIAPLSPVGSLLMGKTTGEKIAFNNKIFSIQKVS